MSSYLPWSRFIQLSVTVSRAKLKRRFLSQLSGYEVQDNKRWGQEKRQAVSTRSTDRWDWGNDQLFTLRKRITKLKSVKSEVSSVNILPSWFPSIGPMAPCRSHHGKHTWHRMDRSSDPRGTESQKSTTKQVEKIVHAETRRVVLVQLIWSSVLTGIG